MCRKQCRTKKYPHCNPFNGPSAGCGAANIVKSCSVVLMKSIVACRLSSNTAIISSGVLHRPVGRTKSGAGTFRSRVKSRASTRSIAPTVCASSSGAVGSRTNFPRINFPDPVSATVTCSAVSAIDHPPPGGLK